MTTYGDYAGYIRNDRTPRHQAFMKKMAEIQAAKNAFAPTVSGSSAGNGGTYSSTYVGKFDFSNLPKGKVSPIAGGKISQNWGKSRIKYAAGRHTGMDFGAKTGTGVRAAASGIVTKVGSKGAYGNNISIRHADGTTTLYAHLSSIGVKAGQRVKVGQGIGKVGNTGRSFGSHLHFETRARDVYGGDINPAKWYGR